MSEEEESVPVSRVLRVTRRAALPGGAFLHVRTLSSASGRPFERVIARADGDVTHTSREERDREGCFPPPSPPPSFISSLDTIVKLYGFCTGFHLIELLFIAFLSQVAAISFLQRGIDGNKNKHPISNSPV